MTQPLLRDVHFWSEATGLLSFPGAEFEANSSELMVLWMVAEPVVRFQTERFDPATLGAGVNVRGLLWTTIPGECQKVPVPGATVMDMIPAKLVGIDAGMAHDDESPEQREPSWQVALRFCSCGYFVAHGFSRPEPIEAEAGA